MALYITCDKWVIYDNSSGKIEKIVQSNLNTVSEAEKFLFGGTMSEGKFEEEKTDFDFENYTKQPKRLSEKSLKESKN